MSREEERTRLEEIKTGKDHHWKNLFLLIIIVVVCDRRKQLNATAREKNKSWRNSTSVKPCSNVFFLFFSFKNVHSSELQTKDACSHRLSESTHLHGGDRWLSVLPGDARRDAGRARGDLWRRTERIQAAVAEGINGLAWARGNGWSYKRGGGVKRRRAWCWTSNCWRPAGGRGRCRRSPLGGGATKNRKIRNIILKQLWSTLK